jgi:hypothetical protein
MSSDSSPQEPLFNKTGPKQNLYLWNSIQHEDFVEWWKTTPWYTNNSAPGKTPRLHFDSKTRTSKVWANFDHAAHFQTGHPYAVCRQCSTALEHPDIKNSGTKALMNHMASLSCKKKDLLSRNQHQQSRLSFSSPLQRVYTLITIKIGTIANIYI